MILGLCDPPLDGGSLAFNGGGGGNRTRVRSSVGRAELRV